MKLNNNYSFKTKYYSLKLNNHYSLKLNSNYCITNVQLVH